MFRQDSSDRDGPAPDRRERVRDDLARLARAAIDGNGAALRTLIAMLTPHLLRVVRKVLGLHHPDLDDVTQDAVLAVAQSLGMFRGEDSVLHFACRIAVLTAMNVRRNEARLKRKGARALADPDQLFDDAPNPETAFMNSALAPVVQQLLDGGLDEVGAERIASVLRLSTAAIAEGRAATPRPEVERSLSEERPASEPSAARPRRSPPVVAPHRSPSLRLGGGYTVGWRGDEGWGHGPRLSLAGDYGTLTWRAHAEAVLPHHAELQGVTLGLASIAAGLAVGAQARVSSLALRGLVGAGASVEHFSSNGATSITAAPSETQIRPFVQLGAELGVPVAAMELAFGLQCALWLDDTRYLIEHADGSERNLGGPGALAPAVSAELRF
jgi:RNA polymerase sigma factor (sigma-70 family)